MFNKFLSAKIWSPVRQYPQSHKAGEISYMGKEEVQLSLIDRDFVSQLSLVYVQFH